MVSFLNKPMGTVCISPIQWLSNSLSTKKKKRKICQFLAPLSRFCPHLKPAGSPLHPDALSSLPPVLSFLLCHSICSVLLRYLCVWFFVSLYLGELGQIPSIPIPQTLSVFGSGVAMCCGQMDPLSQIFAQSFLNSSSAVNPTDRSCPWNHF